MRDTKTGPETGKLKVLLYDVESSPNVIYSWGVYEQNALRVIMHRQIICFAYKWLGDDKIHSYSLPDFKTFKTDPGNNRELIEKLHAVMTEADVVVGHNVIEFDDKMANADFIRHGLTPPSPHRRVDTLQFARSKFRFNSNKLNDIAILLKLGKKVDTGGFDLWARCMAGDLKAYAKMTTYCRNDVALLEKVYLKLRPWMKNHPDMNAIDQNDGCPVCRSKNLISQGYHVVKNGRKPRFQCKDCGKWASGKVVNRAGVAGWKFTG